MSFSVADLERLGQTALQEFSSGVARGSGISDLDMERTAERLQAKLEQLYAVAATMARQEEDLTGVAAIWTGMVTVCDSMAKALSSRAQGTTLESYDRILDIRNICEENRILHA